MSQHPELSLIETADGSNTIYNAAVGEHYHSSHGAVQESRHVFINAGLAHCLAGSPRAKQASILEVGFGTGLNYLLSADFMAGKKTALNYTGIEAYPVDAKLIVKTGYDKYVKADIWQHFSTAYSSLLKGEQMTLGSGRLTIFAKTLLEFESEAFYDIVYFDAFASASQPEMWTDSALAHAAGFLNKGGIFVTYAITGNLKRTLKSLDFKIEKLNGAPGKREMLRAIKH